MYIFHFYFSEKYRDKQNVKYTEQNLNFLRNMNESKESTKEMLRKVSMTF